MGYKNIICIAGKNSIAVNAMRFLLNTISTKNLLFLPNRDDSGINDWQPSFRRFCTSRGIREASLEELQKLSNLIFISLEFDKIIDPSKFLSSELFNIHFSLLPKYKGMYTSALPILNGENSSGVTLHKIDHGIDTGDIIAQIEFEIEASDTAEDLYEKYLENSLLLFKSQIDLLKNGEYQALPQSSKNSSYFSKKSIDYSNISIDLNKTAFEIANQFRAFTFRRYQLPRFMDWEISNATITEEKSRLKPGKIIKEDDISFLISAVDYNLILKKDHYCILWKAAKDNDLQSLTKSIRLSEDIDLRNNNGWTALMIAVFNGHKEAVELLLTKGANPSATNFKGTSVLMYAFSNYEKSKDSSIFKILLQAGADPDSKDDEGKNIVTYMLERNCNNLLKLLTENHKMNAPIHSSAAFQQK